MNIYLLTVWIVIRLIAVWGAAIVIHEIGHAWAFRRITGREVSVRLSRKGFKVGHPEDYEGLKQNQYSAIIVTGIIAGALAIFALAWMLPNEYSLMLIGALYLWGCRTDARYLIKNGGLA